MSKINKHIEAFLEVLTAERGASVNTVSAYQRDLTDLQFFLEAHSVLLEKARSEDLTHYLKMIAQNGYSIKTQSRRLSAIREFYKYLYSEDIIRSNPADYLVSPRQNKTLPKYLSEDEVSRLLSCAAENDFRLKTMLEILYASGMRVSELVGLPVVSVPEESSHLFVVGKGNKERIVPLNEPAVDCLRKWLVQREMSLSKGRVSKWLFPSSGRCGHLTRDGFFKALKKIAIKANIDPKRVSPHVFRHSFASHLIAHNADLRSVQQMLGHADIATTQIYTHILEDRLKKTVEKSHPLAYSAPKG